MLLILAFIKLSKQHDLVFKPTREIIATPEDIGLDFEEVTLVAEDGIKINGWFIKGKKDNKTVLIYHGNGGNISSRLEFISMFYKLGLSVFIIDYRGYGKSGGSPSEKGTYLDSEAAWGFLIKEKNIKKENIIVLGRSLGGPIAARIASKYKPGALILDSTFSSIDLLASELYYNLPIRRFVKFKYNTIGFLEGVNIPILLIHSEQDKYIDISHAERINDFLKDRSVFLRIMGRHGDSYKTSEAKYLKGISEFLKKL